jgi:uncharacterized protein YaiL (DUF2058 family)
MSDSIRDQLIALGLSKDEPTRLPRRKKGRKGGKQPRGGKRSPASGGDISLDKAWKLRDAEEQRRTREAREKKLEEERRRRRINREIKRIVKAGRLNEEGAELARNFLFKGRIRKVMVTPQQFAAINEGRLGVVYLSGGYHLLEPGAVEEVRELSAEHVPDLVDGGSGNLEAGDEGDHPVPDDLLW